MAVDPTYGTLSILGLGVVTFVTHGVFLFPKRAVRIPEWLQRGLKVAPLAALTAVVVPEVITTHGALIGSWHDARLPATVAATLWYLWRPGVLGPLVAGLSVFLPFRLGLGW
jgi:branched-subunit amino acid transport protein